MPRTEDAAAESDSSNATLCDNCSKALQKPLVCDRCKTATCTLAHRKRGGISIKAVIDYSNAHTRETESHANASPSLCLPDPHPFPVLLPDQGVEGRASK